LRFELKDVNELVQVQDFIEQLKESNNSIVLTKMQIDQDILLDGQVASAGISE